MTKAQRKLVQLNARFRKLSPAEKRVRIAKDVIAQVNNRKYKATSGTYLRLTKKVDLAEELQSVLSKARGPQCEVCAIGSVFASLIRKVNNCTVGDVGYDCDMINRLVEEKTFSKSQLRLMETAFEGGVIGEDAELSYEAIARAQNFYENHNDDETARLVAIMRNVIKNNGTFRPR